MSDVLRHKKKRIKKKKSLLLLSDVLRHELLGVQPPRHASPGARHRPQRHRTQPAVGSVHRHHRLCCRRCRFHRRRLCGLSHSSAAIIVIVVLVLYLLRYRYPPCCRRELCWEVIVVVVAVTVVIIVFVVIALS